MRAACGAYASGQCSRAAPRSTAFQRFAIRSDAMARELQQQTAAKQAELLAKSREHAAKLRETVAKAVEEGAARGK